MNFYIKWITGLLAAFAVNSVCAIEITPPTGANRATTVDDFMPHPSISEDFNETWSYQFVFDNGTRAFVNFSNMVVPGSGKKIGCDLTFWNFKGKTYTVGRQYPLERLKKDKTKSTIDIKGEYLMQNKPGKGHRVLFTANKNGKFLLDITFESAEPGKVIGNGTWNIGKAKFGQYIHIPYGRFTGKIAHDNDTLDVKGHAYMDQTWQTVQANEIINRSISFNTVGFTPLNAGRINFAKDGSLFGYAIHKDETRTKLVTAKSITDNGKSYNGNKFPKGEIAFTWNEIIDTLQFSADKTYQKASILDKVEGWFAQKAFKIAVGEILFYRGKSTANNKKTINWCVTGGKD